MRSSRPCGRRGTGALELRGITLRGGRSLLSGGGSILLLPGATLAAEHCAFVGNRAVFGSGGALASRGGAVSLERVRFEANEATLRGGALSLTAYTEADARAAADGSVAAPAAVALIGGASGVVFETNRAGRGGDDVMLCGAGAAFAPRPPPSASVAECAEASATSRAGSVPAEGPAMLRPSDGAMSALEDATEALDLLTADG